MPARRRRLRYFFRRLAWKWLTTMALGALACLRSRDADARLPASARIDVIDR